MSQSSICHRTIRIVLLGALVEGIALACDSPSPTDPHRIPPPTDPTYTVVPSGLSATPVSWSEIDITWPKGSNAATGYELYRSTSGVTGTYTLATSVGASDTNYADVGRTASTQYCYEIRSFKTAGKNTSYSSFSNSVCATTLPPPVAAPSATDAVPIGSSVVRVSWADNSSNEDGFHIERAAAATGPWTQVAVAAANATSISQAATAEQQACFRVIAFNSIGPSLPSAADCTTPPAAPTKLQLTSTGQLSIGIGWVDNSSVEGGYRVSRLQGANGWTDIATLPANATGYTDTKVGAGEKYTYRVQALRDAGYSDYSNELTVTFSGVGDALPPIAPSGLSVGYFADAMYGWLYFGATWTDASSDEAGFRVEVSGDGVSGWLPYTTSGANENTLSQQFSLWGNLGSISQCFRVIAFNGKLDSKPSNVACTDWNRPPTDLAAAPVDQQSIDLTWTDNAWFELGYLIFRSTAVDGDYELVAEVPQNTTSYRDSGLASGQEYWYFVVTNSNDNSTSDVYSYSDRVSATTLSAAASGQASGSMIVGSSPSKHVKRSLRRPPHIRSRR
jgi:fibronectin type 3 domain-containing protein